jgi:hypothetical protein
VFAAKYERWLLWLGALAAAVLGEDVFHLETVVTLALVAPFVVMSVLAARRDRRDLRAIAGQDWKGMSPHARRVFMAVIREPGSVRVDEAGATRTLHDGRVETIRWSDVQSVSVVVLPRRLHPADVLVSLRGEPGSGFALVMPYYETPFDFFVQLQTLPGLDVDRIGAVLHAEPIGTTMCWRRDA